jgi:hypothetical protein
MNWIDFIIGLTLMNAMPHFVLGIWKGRMFSGFGMGNVQNILYGLLNFAISIGLYLYTYSLDHLLGNSMYLGALVLALIYFLTGHFWYITFRKDEASK